MQGAEHTMGCFDGVQGKLGFGLMRLPKIDDEIDVHEVCDMVDAYLAAGFNYFDTAWAYKGSEAATRKALVERYPRESYKLATKIAPWSGCETVADVHRQFETSLERTQAGYFDYYLMHNIGSVRTDAFDRFDVWDFVQEKKREGLVRHMGLSLHDNAAALDALLTAHPEIDFVQLQVNYLDWENPMHQSRACLEVAGEHGKPVVVMEPLRGGLLADPPEEVRDIFKAAEPDASCASWGLRFAASQPGVAVVLSGMSSMDQMEDNIKTMEHFDRLTAQEERVIKQVQEQFQKFDLIPCTACDYCAKVCPADIGISGALLALNAYTMFGRYRQEWIVGGERKGRRKPSDCLQCGACEEVCPQGISIVRELVRASEELDL